jgi:hypothetical protein
MIDLEDLEKVKSYGHWHLSFYKNSGEYYVTHSLRFTGEDEKRHGTTIHLHKIVMDAEKDEIVDHIFRKPLDNRKKFLRIAKNDKNTKNRNGKNKNNKSGYRNVFWHTKSERWLVVLQINGKQKCFGRFKFEDLDKAGILAEEMRQKYYGEFAGIN